MQVRDVSWRIVAIILGFFVTILVLTQIGGDVSTFIIVGMAILGGLGVVAVQVQGTREQAVAVREQSNGNTSRMLDILEKQGQMLAASQPIHADVVDATVVDAHEETS